MTSPPRRIRPVPPETAAKAADQRGPVSDAELLDRLTAALATLPPPERAAAVVAFGLDEGTAGVAEHFELHESDADALTRSAIQLLRGALADVDIDEGEAHARLRRRRRTAHDEHH